MRRTATLLAALALAATALPSRPLRAEAGMGFDGDEHRRLSKEESVRVLENFRHHRMSGTTWLRFVITHVERHSDDETRHIGALATRRDGGDPVTRIELRPEGAPASARRAYLIRSGANPGVWALAPDGKVVRADADALKPLQAGLVFTPYDLQLPFVNWTDARYLNTERFRTRPTDFFRMTPDAPFRTAHPEVASVLLGFDRAYMALMRAETVNAKGETLRDLRAESFGKVDGRWIVRELRLLDGRTRAGDTLAVTSAAPERTDTPDTVFTPEALASPLPLPPEDAFRKAD